MENLALFLLRVGYKKILHFLRLDSREFDFIQAVFLKRSLERILVGESISKYPLFP